MTDRELDALVAQHVFGLVPCSDPLGLCDAAKTTPCQCWGTGGAGEELREFSTDIAAAWTVVEEMGRKGWMLNSKSVDGGWFVGFSPSGDPLTCGRSFEKMSMPRAICLAALRALRVEGV